MPGVAATPPSWLEMIRQVEVYQCFEASAGSTNVASLIGRTGCINQDAIDGVRRHGSLRTSGGSALNAHEVAASGDEGTSPGRRKAHAVFHARRDSRSRPRTVPGRTGDARAVHRCPCQRCRRFGRGAVSRNDRGDMPGLDVRNGRCEMPKATLASHNQDSAMEALSVRPLLEWVGRKRQLLPRNPARRGFVDEFLIANVEPLAQSS